MKSIDRYINSSYWIFHHHHGLCFGFDVCLFVRNTENCIFFVSRVIFWIERRHIDKLFHLFKECGVYCCCFSYQKISSYYFSFSYFYIKCKSFKLGHLFQQIKPKLPSRLYTYERVLFLVFRDDWLIDSMKYNM